MNYSVKKTVVFFLFGAWMSLFAVHAAEAFGYFEDTPEYSNKSIEQTLLTPADIVPQFSAQFSVLKQISAISMDRIDPSFFFNPQTLQSNPHPFSLVDAGSPPGSPPPLFQLFSNLRL